MSEERAKALEVSSELKNELRTAEINDGWEYIFWDPKINDFVFYKSCGYITSYPLKDYEEDYKTCEPCNIVALANKELSILKKNPGKKFNISDFYGVAYHKWLAASVADYLKTGGFNNE